MWETLAHDVEAEHLINRVIDAHNQDDKEAVESYLCGKLVIFPRYFTVSRGFLKGIH